MEGGQVKEFANSYLTHYISQTINSTPLSTVWRGREYFNLLVCPLISTIRPLEALEMLNKREVIKLCLLGRGGGGGGVASIDSNNSL